MLPLDSVIKISECRSFLIMFHMFTPYTLIGFIAICHRYIYVSHVYYTNMYADNCVCVQKCRTLISLFVSFIKNHLLYRPNKWSLLFWKLNFFSVKLLHIDGYLDRYLRRQVILHIDVCSLTTESVFSANFSFDASDWNIATIVSLPTINSSVTFAFVVSCWHGFSIVPVVRPVLGRLRRVHIVV